MHVIDAHCDTLYAMCKEKTQLQFTYDLVKSLNMPYLQFFAMYSPPSLLLQEGGFDQSVKIHLQMLKLYEEMTKKYSYTEVLCKKDIIAFEKTDTDSCNTLFSLLSVEGVYLSKGELSYIDYLYDNGVRCLSLPGIIPMSLPKGLTEIKGGLTVLGRKAVKNVTAWVFL